MKMTGRGQITIPKAIRDAYGFKPNVEVDVSVQDGVVRVQPTRDAKSFDLAVNEWQGKGSDRLKKLEFDSTDEWIEALRGA